MDNIKFKILKIKYIILIKNKKKIIKLSKI